MGESYTCIDTVSDNVCMDLNVCLLLDPFRIHIEFARHVSTWLFRWNIFLKPTYPRFQKTIIRLLWWHHVIWRHLCDTFVIKAVNLIGIRLVSISVGLSLCLYANVVHFHDDVIKWKHFPRNWPFVREIHRSPVNFPHKGQWRGALMFSLIYAWISDWVNNREAGDLRRQHGHYDVIVMYWCILWEITCMLQECMYLLVSVEIISPFNNIFSAIIHNFHFMIHSPF